MEKNYSLIHDQMNIDFSPLRGFQVQNQHQYYLIYLQNHAAL